MKRTEYNKAMVFLKRSFPKSDIPAETFKLWYDTVFANMDYELFLFRLADCIEECSYIPMPAYFCSNQDYVFWLNNRNAMSKRLVDRLENIKKVVANV
ncbi:MAG TPA: hypothetical protein PLB16_12985 [bacterium]|mgnify:CR=1 FL=1|nr:hypothetical protein [bacterium]